MILSHARIITHFENTVPVYDNSRMRYSYSVAVIWKILLTNSNRDRKEIFPKIKYALLWPWRLDIRRPKSTKVLYIYFTKSEPIPVGSSVQLCKHPECGALICWWIFIILKWPSYGLISVRVPSHVSRMRCIFAQNYVNERDSNISASLSLSWFRAKTQRIPDTWDGTLKWEQNSKSTNRRARTAREELAASTSDRKVFIFQYTTLAPYI